MLQTCWVLNQSSSTWGHCDLPSQCIRMRGFRKTLCEDEDGDEDEEDEDKDEYEYEDEDEDEDED